MAVPRRPSMHQPIPGQLPFPSSQPSPHSSPIFSYETVTPANFVLSPSCLSLTRPGMTSETLRPNGWGSHGTSMGGSMDEMRDRGMLLDTAARRTIRNEVSPTLSVIMISGGTGGNCFATPTKNCMHVLPVSDDGGSSSEILRVLGGPSVGDIRSRLIRLIPLEGNEYSTSDPTAIKAIRNLLIHRFPTTCTEKAAREMWADVVEGRSALWRGMPMDRRECLRAVLVHFHSLILKRTHKKFSFRNFSIGNGFLAGARDMLGGLPSAIFMFQALTETQNIAPVIPVILTNQALTIAAELKDGSRLVGQSEISHPAPQQPSVSSARKRRRRRDSNNFDTAESVGSSSEDDSDKENNFITSRRGSTASSFSEGHFITSRRGSTASSVSEGGFDGLSRMAQGSPWNDNFLTETMMGRPKTSKLENIRSRPRDLHEEDDDPVDLNSLYVKGEPIIPLDSPIKRVYYVNNYSAEIFPEPNPTLLEQLANREMLIYSAGSLWTSIVPCLALRGMATAIARSGSLRAKVMLLNSVNDRETLGYTARDYIEVIVRMLNRANKPQRTGVQRSRNRKTIYQAEELISHLVYLEAGEVEIDPAGIRDLGIEVIKVPASSGQWFSNENVKWALAQIERSLG